MESNSISLYSDYDSVSQNDDNQYAYNLQSYEIRIKKPDQCAPKSKSGNETIQMNTSHSQFVKPKVDKKSSDTWSKEKVETTVNRQNLKKPILERLKEAQREENRRQKLFQPISGGFSHTKLTKKRIKKSIKTKRSKKGVLPSIYHPTKTVKTARNPTHKSSLRIKDAFEYNKIRPSRNFTKLNLFTKAGVLSEGYNRNH